MSGSAEQKQIKNARSGIAGCNSVWPYDPDAAYAGMKAWAELLLAQAEKVEELEVALRELEWAGVRVGEESRCLICAELSPNHDPECIVLAALSKEDTE